MARGETIRAKELRRGILMALRAARGPGYDGWLSARSLWNTLRFDADGLTRREVEEHLRYLAEKEYAEVRERREAKWDACEVDGRITARGIDLLEETIPADPGVEDNRA